MRRQGNNKVAADWLLNIDERRAQYEEKRMTIPRTDSGAIIIAGGGKGGRSDKTAQAAIELADMDAYFWSWYALIRDVERRLEPDKMLLLRHKRQGLNYRQFMQAQQYCKSRNWFNRKWKEIVEVAAGMAAERGLFD